MYQYINEKQKRQLFGVVLCVLAILAIFILVEAVDAIKQFSYIGHDTTNPNQITVSGTGQVLAVPDIATFSFSVVEDAKQMTDAQNTASAKMNSVISALKTLGVAENDIQTTDYSSNPTYQYSSSVCPQPVPEPAQISGGAVSSIAVYCPPGKQVLTGYEVNQTVTVKIRKTADAGTILAKIGTLGVSNISGISFTVDDMTAVQAQARDKAIADAKSKAQALSKSLGIKLNHIVNFNDNSVFPMVYAVKSEAVISGATASVAPEIPVGQNEVTSNVTITYEVN